jgi:hypothetical protein
MSKKRTIKSWIDNLPDEAIAIRIRLGSGRNQPTLSIIALENSGFKDQEDAGVIFCKPGERAELIETLALDAGWKTEEPTLRLHAISRTGKAMASWQLTDRGQREKSQMGSDYSIGALTDGILSMASQLTKTIDILTESLAHSESSRAHMFEAMLEAREDQLTSETHAILAAMDQEPEPPDPLKMQAVQAFQTVAQSLAGVSPGAGEFTAEDVRKRAEEDIWFKSDLASEWVKMNQNTSSSPGAPSSPGESQASPGQQKPDLKSETDPS